MYQILFECFEYSNFWKVLLKFVLFWDLFSQAANFSFNWVMISVISEFLYPSALVESSGEMFWEITLIFFNAPLILCTFFFFFDNWFVFLSFWRLTGNSPIIDRLLFRSCKSVSLSKKAVEVCGWSSVDGEAVSDRWFCQFLPAYSANLFTRNQFT